MSNYFATSYKDLERAVVQSTITEECIKIGRGNIKTESSKFIFNGCNAYTHVRFNLFTVVSFKDRDRLQFERFTEKYLNDPTINGSTLNPKVLAFCYLLCVLPTIDGSYVFSRYQADLLVRGLYALKMKNSTVLADIFKIERLKDFIRENGITEIDIIRYIIFIEKKENS